MATTAVSVYVVPGKPLVVAVVVLPGGRVDAVVDVVVTRGDEVGVFVGDGEFVVVEVGVGVLMAVGVGVGVIGRGAGVGLACLVGIGAGVIGIGAGVGFPCLVGVCFIGITIAFPRVDVSIGTRIRFVTEFTPVDAGAARACILVISAHALISEHSNTVMESTPMIILLGVSLAHMI